MTGAWCGRTVRDFRTPRPEERAARGLRRTTLISGIVATDKWLTRFRTILVAVLGATVLGIACLAFYTSFEAIRPTPSAPTASPPSTAGPCP